MTGLDPFAIIVDAHPKLILIITDLDFDMAADCIRECSEENLYGW
jgi:hypothetical protein